MFNKNIRKLVLGTLFCTTFLIAGFAINTSEAIAPDTEGKACTDIMNEKSCCEKGEGSCGETVELPNYRNELILLRN